jgi:TDG/mug DNA glycosylase family protein
MITDLTGHQPATLNRGMRVATEKAELSHGFPPVVGRAPRVLILGSLPGRASIEAGEYYAQAHNAFWPIMGELCAADPGLDYAQRLGALTRAGIALWDVLCAAVRPGSLDADIVTVSQQINGIAEFVSRRRSIELIGFNGKKAADVFRRYIERELPRRDIRTVTLPSTSPAYASLRREQKLDHWRAELAPHLRAG